MVHSPKAEGHGFQNKEEAGCAGTRCSPSPPPYLLQQLKAWREPGAPTHLARQCCAQPLSEGEKRPSSALFQRGCGCGALPHSWGPRLLPLWFHSENDCA